MLSDEQLIEGLGLSEELLGELGRQASIEERSFEDLVAKRLGVDPDPDSEGAAPLRYSCPVEGCPERGRTLAAVCSTHNCHMA